MSSASFLIWGALCSRVEARRIHVPTIIFHVASFAFRDLVATYSRAPHFPGVLFSFNFGAVWFSHRWISTLKFHEFNFVVPIKIVRCKSVQFCRWSKLLFGSRLPRVVARSENKSAFAFGLWHQHFLDPSLHSTLLLEILVGSWEL